MANLRKRGKRWRAEVYRRGVRESQSFHTRAEAAAWALGREAEITGVRLPEKSLRDALERYDRDVTPTKRGARWEALRLTRWAKTWPMAAHPIATLTAADIAEWRDGRLQSVTSGTVNREMNLLRSVLETARKEWGWLRDNPMRDVRRPMNPPPRRRRVSQDEIDRLCMALGYTWPQKPVTASHRVALAFLLALETAMRAGEMVGLAPEHIHLKERYVDLPRTKNGDARRVPLSKRAVAILKLVPNGFDLEPGTRDALFRRARDNAEITNLHFHDSRAEAIWRLSKKLDVLQLARVIGHRDVRSIMFYYDESASDIAKQLD